MVLEGDSTDDKKRVLIFFENRSELEIAPKDVEKGTQLDLKSVRKALDSLLKEGRIRRVSRGKYIFLEQRPPILRDDINRYLNTLERTCQVAIHELMLTEDLVDAQQLQEIEHQIAFFARKMVWARWEQEYGKGEDITYDEATFKRASKIHEWSRYIFELSKKKGKKS